ncbi:response regulator [Geobacter pelophilus]|uniref:histidine kinase n=1 Tax=Geoanaerobacter pelophilus TaxID=60036 RepID=A0AAW4L0E3_9BACT|nr:response regulator [Geoanaerobacter pelophilus]MBT0663632.1 response regulator [Geoanaerobacter pelophilus]
MISRETGGTNKPSSMQNAEGDHGEQLQRSRMLKVWIATVAALLAGMLLSGTAVWLYETNRMQQHRQAVAELTNQVADDLHDNLNRSLSSTYALAAVIRQNNGNIANFPQLATEMLTLYPGIGNLQIAPKGIVSQIVPLAGNEKAIGHNLLEDTKRNKEALQAVQTRALTLAGPFELIQGGKATIGRLPIFLHDRNGADYFWGFSIALIRIQEFLKVANIQRIADKGCSYEISRIHPDSGKKDVFASSGKPLTEPVKRKIKVPNGEWTLAVEPLGGWYSLSIVLAEALFILLFSSLTALAVRWLTRQPIILQQMVDERTGELSSTNAKLQTEIKERKHAEEELLASENKLRSIFASLTDVIIILDENGRYIEIAPTSTDQLYRPTEELLGKGVTEVFPPEQAEFFIATIRRTLVSGQMTSVDYQLTIGDEPCWFTGNVSRLTATTVVWSARNITQRKKSEEERLQLEKQLLHTQKLESLGVLAGGIAHDFNNILTAIIGNADLALARLTPESPVIEHLQRIEKAATRASDLARQMLAYSGKGRFVIEELDLNRLLEEMGHMLEVSISKKAVLRYNLQRPLPAITADATQIRQIIMNLVINASEAIGDKSGIIAITTGCLELTENYRKHLFHDEQMPDGVYVFAEIADTGCGMNKETLAKVFDPFFTTKFTGRGLGMAAVLGIVRGHKGAIKVYSEEGKGTTFKVLFPAGAQPFAPCTRSEDLSKEWRGSGTVLLVDDEATILELGSEMLRELGYEVITARDGREGLHEFTSRDNIGIVILDLTMPHMDGEQCFRELRQINPEVRVIMSSGFNEQEVTQKFVGKGLAGFIQKPYKLSELRKVLMNLSR